MCVCARAHALGGFDGISPAAHSRIVFVCMHVAVCVCVDRAAAEMRLSFVCLFLPFLGPCRWHMEVPRPGVESEL